MTQAPTQQPFNPDQHLMDLGGKAYLEVKWRLFWYRRECPNGTIDTEEIAVDLDREVEKEVLVWDEQTRKKVKVMKRAQGYARYKAIVTDGKGGRATGTKTETAVDFPDFCEKAETGAIGRALAGLGYGTQFALELEEGERIVDAPVTRKASETRKSEQVSSYSPQNGKETPAPSQTVVEASPEEIEKMMNSVKSLLASHYQIPLVDQPAQWQLFKAQVLGLPVADEGLTMREVKRLRGVIDAKIKQAKAS